MLKSFLSKIQQLSQKLKKQPLQKEESPLNNSFQAENAEILHTPNLLENSFQNSDFGVKHTNQAYILSLIRVVQVLILMLPILAISFGVVNKLLFDQVSKLLVDVNVLAIKAFKHEEYRPEVRAISQKINSYKAIAQNKNSVSGNVASVLGALSSTDIELQSVAFSRENAQLSLSSRGALSFAILLDKLVKEPEIKEVHLLAADLVNSENGAYFNVGLEVLFK
jgi:hypothetical protein